MFLKLNIVNLAVQFLCKYDMSGFLSSIIFMQSYLKIKSENIGICSKKIVSDLRFYDVVKTSIPKVSSKIILL